MHACTNPRLHIMTRQPALNVVIWWYSILLTCAKQDDRKSRLDGFTTWTITGSIISTEVNSNLLQTQTRHPQQITQLYITYVLIQLLNDISTDTLVNIVNDYQHSCRGHASNPKRIIARVRKCHRYRGYFSTIVVDYIAARHVFNYDA